MRRTTLVANEQQLGSNLNIGSYDVQSQMADAVASDTDALVLVRDVNTILDNACNRVCALERERDRLMQENAQLEHLIKSNSTATLTPSSTQPRT
jgi:hypothetical protein